jgi:muramoyltetrapeptide carboxypeptidase
MIKKGDIIDIVFPSTCCTKAEISQIKNYLKNLGLIPRILLEKTVTPKKNPNCSLPSFSASARFEQLYQALQSKDSSLVWCGRGGYGSADLLPFLAKAKPIKQNKMFIGFSDLTSINTFLQQNWGWKIIAAPMLGQMVGSGKWRVSKKSEQALLDLIFGKKTELQYGLKPLNGGTKNIKAEIIGGCLSVLSGNCGGDSQINFADKILFLEDVDDSGERLDKYFWQMIQIMLKTKKPPKAIVLGEFTYGMTNKFMKQNVELAIKSLVQKIADFKLDIPVFKAKEPLGHSNKMLPLILGVESEIDVKKLNIKIRQ